MPPYTTYLIYGTVKSADSNISPNSKLQVKTSVGSHLIDIDSDGLFVFDLADVGYIADEVATLKCTEEFNNEYIEQEFTVSGWSQEITVTMEVRTLVKDVADYSSKTVLHTVGKSAVTKDNPLDVRDRSDPLAGYILSGSDDDNAIYGYMNKNGAWYIFKNDSTAKTYKYVFGDTDFSSNWTNRANLTYAWFNEAYS